jgi:predicted permease
MPFVNEITVDSTVVAVTILICLATTLLFGLLPAVWQSRIQSADSLKAGARSTASIEVRSLQRALLVGQIALALALVASAALLLESFRRLIGVDLGYKPQQVITLDLGGWKIPTNEDNVRMYREIKREVAALPGVEAVGTIQSIPFTGKWTWEEKAQVLGDTRAPLEQPSLAITFVAFDYFDVMQIPLIAGRVFSESELRDDGYGNVIIINEAAAKALFPGQSALGKSFAISSSPDRYYEVIGVVRDTRDVKLELNPPPRFYLNYTHGGSQLLVRTSAPPEAMVPMIRSVLKKFGSQLIVSTVKPMSEIISDTVAERRFLIGMLTSYAALALGIAAVGIFGVTAYQVAQRTNEFGVRLALGATPQGLTGQVLRETARWTSIGVIVGIILAFGASQALASQLYDLSPHDPFIFTGVTLLLFAIGLLASFFPARRAANVDPLKALRCE